MLAPDEAFAVLGNETHLQILQTLGEADSLLSFSALRDRVEMRDRGQFNYHLDKLAGHFVRKTANGYTLRQAVTRVVEAILTGAVTDAPVLEPTQIDESCPHCGAPVEVYFREEFVGLRCTECAGTYPQSFLTSESIRERARPVEHGFLGELEYSHQLASKDGQSRRYWRQRTRGLEVLLAARCLPALFGSYRRFCTHL